MLTKEFKDNGIGDTLIARLKKYGKIARFQ
jgi:hypothetical protein